MDTFEYWSDLCLAVQRGKAPEECWAEVRKETPKMLQEGNTPAIRRAYNKLLRELGSRTSNVAAQSDLSSVFIQYLDKYKKAWTHRTVAIYGLKALCDIPNENIRGIRNNVFLVLAECLKSPGSNITYKLALIETLSAAYTSSADLATVKQVWKAARAWAIDPCLAISSASITLLLTVLRPDFLKTAAKFEKIEKVCLKAFALELPAQQLLARATYMHADATEHTTQETLVRLATEYSQAPLLVAKGIVGYMRECIHIQLPTDFAQAISTITALIQNPKLRDPYRVSLAFQHIHYLIVDVIAQSLVDERQKMHLVQTLVTKLATSDRQNQLLSASLVPCLASLLKMVVLPASLADIMYQATIALFEMSVTPELTLQLLDFFTKFVKVVPFYFAPMGSYCLEKLETSSKIEHAYFLGAVLTTSNSQGRMAELKVDVVEQAMALVKQKDKDFTLERYRQGWVLLQAFCSTPDQALRLFIPHYLNLFGHMLALPKDNLAGNELRYQIEIWKPVLSCMVEFTSTSLITPDISRKLGGLLQQVWNYLEKLPSSTFTEEPLIQEDTELRRRLLACYSTMNFHGDTRNFPATLLTTSLKYISQSSRISSLIMDSCDVDYTRDYKNDPISILKVSPAPPPTVDLIDQAINVVITLLPLQLDRVQESLLDALRSHIEVAIAPPKKKGVEKKERIENTAYLFSRLCEVDIQEQRIVRIVDSVLKVMISNNVVFSSPATGKFVKNHKSYSAELAKFLIDQAIAKVDQPFIRASYCNALAALILGGGLNSRNLKEISNLLASLSNDPHPAVHMAAIDAYTASYTSCGLLDNKEALELLQSFSKLYNKESHSRETSELDYSNQEMCENNTWVRLSRGMAGTVSLIGPSLQADDNLFNIFYRLIDQLDGFSDLTTKYTWECFQEAFYYATDRINWLEIIPQWRDCINSAKSPPPVYYDGAVKGILLFANRAASKLFDITGPQFERELWLAYDVHPSPYIKQIFTIWAEQTVVVEPQLWIERLQQVISKPRRFTDYNDEDVQQASNRNNQQNDVEIEEEDESLGPKAEKSNNELFNLATRKLALDILLSITESQLHNKPLAKRQASLITQNIGEIIKISFNAATSTVLDLQISGLNLLNLLIKYLHDLHDPDFPEVSLLEQYQAQISSALTPAFHSDSSYELASAVTDVCANFVSSGIMKNTEKFNKILRILTDPLTSDDFGIGKLKLEPLQSTALKIKISRFWAILEADKSPVAEKLEDMLGKLWIQSLTDYTKLEFRPEDQSYTSFFAECVEKFSRYNRKQALLPVYRESWIEMVKALAVLVERHGSQIITKDEDFMFGLVGLCFAELLKKDGKDSLSVLSALKHILQPGVCASLVYDNEIFLEVVGVLDRIVLTGSIPEKALIVEIARNLASSQADNDESVDDLFEIFRTCVFPLKELFPFLNDPKRPINPKAEQEMPLIKLALDSLIDMVPVFRKVIQIDQYCCLMFIFEQIFSNPDCQEKIVPHIFSSYKRLIENMTCAYAANPDVPIIGRSICDAFVRSTNLLKDAKDTVMSTNSMLTSMVILCTAKNILEPVLGNIEELGAILAKNIGPGLKVAIQSLRTILCTCKGATYDAIVYGAVPELMDQLEGKQDRIPKDVCNLLVEYAKNTPDVGTALSIVTPALMQVLNSQCDLEERRNMYVRALLYMLLEAHPQDFKRYMGQISPQDKQTIQELLMEPAEPELIPETSSEITLTSFN